VRIGTKIKSTTLINDEKAGWIPFSKLRKREKAGEAGRLIKMKQTVYY